MTMQDFEYFSRRARQERECAARCGDQGARIAHLELAARYAAMVEELAVLRAPAGRALG